MPDDPDRDLAEARADAAADERRRARISRELLDGETTFVALLASLCEREADVVVDTAAGSHLVCRIDAVSAEVVRLSSGAGTVTVLRHDAIVAVRVPGHPHAADAPGATHTAELATITMGDVLVELAGRRTPVAIREGGQVLRGEIRGVGDDVVTLLTAGAGSDALYVRVGSVREISFSASS